MSNEITKPVRPFALEYADAKNEIFDVINQAAHIHGVPFFLIEGIVTDILHQVKENASVERQNAKALYEKQLAESKEAPKEKNNLEKKGCNQ